MNLTRRIAAVLGPTLIAVTTSETLNLEIWKEVDPTLVYLNGLLFLIGGLVIVTNHNVWQPFRSILVTIGGWLLTLAGGYRMFLPTAAQLGPDPITHGFIALLGAYGLVLTVIAFLKN
jgi:hypothetical protein